MKLPNRRMPIHFKKNLRQKIDKFLRTQIDNAKPQSL